MRRGAFTLIELLVVLAIIVALAGLTAGITSKDRKDGLVRAAAEELAATLRLARSRAVDQAAVVGVAFNIRNGVGTSGRILNNFDGGHWYRIIGSDEYSRGSVPAMSGQPSGIPQPDFYTASALTWWEGKSLGGYLRMVQDAWVGDRHTLAPRQVRFLAVSDQDNGSYIRPESGSGTQTFVATYPRPWFGTWLAGRLYAWGGYDPAIRDAGNRPCSGFYYQGDETVAIPGCTNPEDRATTWEVGQPSYGIFTKGEGRPLVNGDWLDYVICFYPDGSAREDKPMRGRIGSWSLRGSPGGGGTGGTGKGDLGHMTGCNLPGVGSPDWPAAPMTSYADVTGSYAITLAPDAASDSDAFASPREALASLMPAYRVLVSRRGQVRVARVAPYEPNGTVWLPAVTWSSIASLRSDYRYLYRTTQVGGAYVAYGRPAETFVTAGMLDGTGGQRWWIQP